MAIEPVRSLVQFLVSWPGRKDAQFAVDLQRIGIDDHATPFPRQLQGKGGLAAGGRACNKQR